MQVIDPKYFMLNCKFIDRGLLYEDDLIEVLNWSRFFRNKSQDKSEYVAPTSQDSGEADAYSTEYQIDFKLVVDEEVMQGLNKNKPTVDKKHIKQGIIIVNDNPNPTPIPPKNILADIMSIFMDEIQSNRLSSNTIKHFIENLEKNKNLLLYYPYEYVSNTVYPVQAFSNMLTQVFRIPLIYRKQKCPDKDTFACIKVNKNFLIFEWIEDAFVYRDSVNELLCATYRDYKLYSVF
ncbi:hypothetical protein [Zongyangia hominis]|uniref:Uncharacterized protein n=1 Tax=Zongyangia hominis TaxID=2763677 RepID=A0A926EFD1_9FIRM|nr:hypothetical protein [Zongyangia hominis]MBC8571459.1 hypothetical protein [Zongyangia hominis]